MQLPIFRDLYRLNVALLKDVENIPKISKMVEDLRMAMLLEIHNNTKEIQ